MNSPPQTVDSPERWLYLGLILLAQISISAVVLGVSALIPFLQAELHLTRGQVGLLVAAVNLGTLAALPLVGWAARTPRLAAGAEHDSHVYRHPDRAAGPRAPGGRDRLLPAGLAGLAGLLLAGCLMLAAVREPRRWAHS